MLSFCRVCLCFARKFVADCFGRQIFGGSITFWMKPPPKSFDVASGCIEKLTTAMGRWDMLPFCRFCLFLLEMVAGLRLLQPEWPFRWKHPQIFHCRYRIHRRIHGDRGRMSQQATSNNKTSNNQSTDKRGRSCGLTTPAGGDQ